MEYSIRDLLSLIGALGFFIYGMKVMSEGLQKSAGDKLRQILGAMTKNRFFGVFTGFLITSIVQSSSATTVLTVSFVNAGLLSLVESAGVMMGANIGTTITAWLISIFGFKVKIVAIALPIIAVGFPLLFSKNGKTRSIAEVLIGFALLFMGLNELKHSVPDIKSNPEILEFLASYSDLGFLSALMFVFIGAVLTIIIQSSSAAMALTLVMCNNGWIPFETAAAMVLGENIGTTITAELASIVGNVHAKRSARIHSMFNIIGVTWMLLAMPLFLRGVTWMMDLNGLGNPYESSSSIPIALSIFHTTFNLTNVLLLIWFVPVLVKLATKSVVSKGDHDEEFHLEYIGHNIMSTPELSLAEAGKEIQKFAGLIKKMNARTIELLTESDKKSFSKSMSKIKKYEVITDQMEREIAKYLTKVAENKMSEEATVKLRSALSIVNDLERVADILYQISLLIERNSKSKTPISPMQVKNIQDMFELCSEAVKHMERSLNNEHSENVLLKARELEDSIDNYRNKLRRDHLESIHTSEFNFNSGMIYQDLFSSIEKMGDHIINVSEAIEGKI